MKRESTTFQTLFLIHHRRIYRLLFRVVGNAQEAEDLAQETFLRLHKHLEELELERVHLWLQRVAMNLGLNAIRGRKRRWAWQEKVKLESDVTSSRVELDSVESRLVRETLGQLSERQANLLMLHAAGFRYEELAEVLGIQKSSVSKLLLRARKAFLKAYAQEEGA